MIFARHNRIVRLAAASLALMCASSAFAQMASPSYRIQADAVDAGGARSSSASYVIEDTAGETGTGDVAGGSYGASIGFQQNYGTSSATSTPAPEPIPTPVPAPAFFSDLRFSVFLYGIVAIPGVDSIEVIWMTNVDSDGKVSWGRTLELGNELSQGAFYKVHTLTIRGLAPATDYYLKLASADALGRTGAVDAFKVQTLPARAEELPTNVSNFSAVERNGDAALSWKNPTSPAWRSVRIVRSEEFFPSGTDDGAIVYEGQSESHLDESVEQGKTYYYAAFAKDAYGNWSSGAVASVYIPRPGEAAPEGSPLDDLPASTEVDERIRTLGIGDFRFIQGNEVLDSVGQNVVIDGSKNLKIEIDYARMPEILKTIAVTLTDPVDPKKRFTFLLRVNAGKTSYGAVIGALERSGVYGMRITVVDFKNRGMKTLPGSITVPATASQPIEAGDGGGRAVLWLLLAIALVGMCIAMFLVAKRRKRDDKRPQE